MCMHVCLCVDTTCVQVCTGVDTARVQVCTGARRECWIPSSSKSPMWALGTELSSLEGQRVLSTPEPSLQAHTSSFLMWVLGSNSSHEATMAGFYPPSHLTAPSPSFSSMFGFPAFNPAHRGFHLCSAIFFLCWSFRLLHISPGGLST